MSDPPGYVLMLFDGHCNLCNGGVRFLLPRSPPRLRFCAMQTPSGQARLRALGLPLEEFATLAVVEGATVHLKSAAVLRLGELMAPPWPSVTRLLRHVPPRWLDRFYDLVASHRYRIAGRRDSCPLPDPSVRERFLW